MRTELLNIYTYLKYLLDTVNKLLEENPAEHMYQAAWLSKCLNLEEILIIFQNQFISKREKFNLVLDNTLKELNSDIDTKIKTIDTKTQTDLPEEDVIRIELAALQENLQKRFERIDNDMSSFLNHIRAVNNELTALKEIRDKDLQKIDTAMVNIGTEIHATNTRLQELANEKQILAEQEEDTSTPLKTPKSWSVHVDEVKQKMKEKGWNEHQVCDLAKINFNSFRKFQKKDPKLSNVVVNKILELFNIHKDTIPVD
jgi:hypothetical protein